MCSEHPERILHPLIHKSWNWLTGWDLRPDESSQYDFSTVTLLFLFSITQGLALNASLIGVSGPRVEDDTLLTAISGTNEEAAVNVRNKIRKHVIVFGCLGLLTSAKVLNMLRSRTTRDGKVVLTFDGPTRQGLWFVLGCMILIGGGFAIAAENQSLPGMELKTVGETTASTYRFNNDGAEGFIVTAFIQLEHVPPVANKVDAVATLPDDLMNRWRIVGVSAQEVDARNRPVEPQADVMTATQPETDHYTFALLCSTETLQGKRLKLDFRVRPREDVARPVAGDREIAIERLRHGGRAFSVDLLHDKKRDSQ